ncbi:MAG: hypothetical protein L3J89_02680 [Gammaproteobacteria bacterium]|nr:hypothetical protein [Gammaproteobacteria bacterium]
MKMTRNCIYPVLAVLATAIVSGCGGSDSVVNNGDPGSGNKPPPSSGITTLQIDATAGGFGTSPTDPANKYSYLNLKSGMVVNLSDAEAAVSSAWHIAFKRTSIKLNGGVSGPGTTQGAVADAQNDFYDAATGDAIASVFSNASPASELAAFEAVTTTNSLSFTEDRNIPYITGDGSSDGWWLNTATISANPDQWWLIKSATANSYAKFHVTDIVPASRDITLELFIQGAVDSAFSATATTWTAVIGVAGGSKCFDIDTAAEVDCTSSAADWDLKVEVAGQDWSIWTNGGVSGSGSGGAFGSFDPAGAASYVSGTAAPGGTDISGFYRQDSAGGTFEDNTWYAYNVLNQSPPLLWSNYRVYAIDTGTAQYKLQILSYYNQATVSGNYTVRFAPLTAVSSAENVVVSLSEWAVTPDKTMVNAGPVNFNITNDGPVDVHEFVIFKTDLAFDNLPLDANGNVDENGAGIMLIGEIENISVGESAQITFDLAPGNYVLICNIWDAGEAAAHYTEGMRVAFTVQ